VRLLLGRRRITADDARLPAEDERPTITEHESPSVEASANASGSDRAEFAGVGPR
jgi:hypothetical protein